MILTTNKLQKSFGKIKALQGVSLQINKGEIFGLVGPDGAGKTTFIRTILGLYLQDSGDFSLFGTEQTEDIKQKIGYVPQLFSLNQDMTVWENISLFGSLYGIAGDVFQQRANELLDMVWLSNFKDRLAGNLSGGMKQKLALVAGLLHRPELLILDEPTTGVDPVSRREFWQLLYRLNQQGLTLLVTTPYMDEVELCHRLAFFHNGQVKALGSPAQLLTQYPYNLFSLQAEGLRSLLGKIEKLPAHDVYLQGNEIHIALKNPNTEKPLLDKAIEKLGLKEYSLSQISPTLEDLFSILSTDEESAP